MGRTYVWRLAYGTCISQQSMRFDTCIKGKTFLNLVTRQHNMPQPMVIVWKNLRPGIRVRSPVFQHRIDWLRFLCVTAWNAHFSEVHFVQSKILWITYLLGLRVSDWRRPKPSRIYGPIGSAATFQRQELHFQQIACHKRGVGETIDDVTSVCRAPWDCS